MSSRMQKNTSSIITAFFIGLIIISFMFTGYETLVKSSNHMAIVGDYSIALDEFSREYNNDIQRLSKMMGGKAPSQKMIRQYKIKERTTSRLIDRKLLLNLADQLEIHPAPENIKKKIKEFPGFLTDKLFDLKKYKAVLKANALTPGNFEERITEQIKLESILPLLEMPAISTGYLDPIKKYKSQKRNGTLIKFDKNSLIFHIPIPASKVSLFLAEAKNQEQVKKIFEQKKNSLSTQEQVKASHILFRSKGEDEKKVLKKIKEISAKLTVKNFAKMAEKYTEDPSGKKNGGSLGWFSQGRMVPQFEKVAFTQKAGTISKPVKTPFGHHIIYTQEKKPVQAAVFEQHKISLTKKILQKKDRKARDILVEKLTKQIHSLLQKNQIKKIESMKRKYNLTIIKNQEFDRLSGKVGNIDLSPPQIIEVFKKKSSGSFVFDDLAHVLIIKAKKTKSNSSPKKTDYQNNYKLANRFNSDILKQLKEVNQIKVYNN